MYKTGIRYTFPSDTELELYNLPKTATEENTRHIPRNEIIREIIPNENKILKDILTAYPDIDFGYLNKGENTTKTIDEASKVLDYPERFILKTMVSKDKEGGIYTFTTLGDSGIKVGTIRKLKQPFRDANEITGPLELEPIEQHLIKEYTGTEAGYCGPIPLDNEYLEKINGILIQKRISKPGNSIPFITFPIGQHESIFMSPKELYKSLIQTCGIKKVSTFQ